MASQRELPRGTFARRRLLAVLTSGAIQSSVTLVDVSVKNYFSFYIIYLLGCHGVEKAVKNLGVKRQPPPGGSDASRNVQ